MLGDRTHDNITEIWPWYNLPGSRQLDSWCVPRVATELVVVPRREERPASFFSYAQGPGRGAARFELWNACTRPAGQAYSQWVPGTSQQGTDLCRESRRTVHRHGAADVTFPASDAWSELTDPI